MKKIIFITLMFLGISFIANAFTVLDTSKTMDEETYVCTVWGWNNATGEEQKINIYICHSRYSGTYYVGREVTNGNVSSLYGIVKLVTNPSYSREYKYFVKTGMVGAFFFNTNRLNDNYLKD